MSATASHGCECPRQVFDGNILPDGSSEQSEVRLGLQTGIVGHVVTTGRLININNAYTHPLFYPGCDQETGFKTRWALGNSIFLIIILEAAANTFTKTNKLTFFVSGCFAAH